MTQDETAAQHSANVDSLTAAARSAALGAYRPYSGLGVGAAGLAVGPDADQPAGDSDGRVRIVVGCNVENASYGLTLCAECSLVSDLHRTGGGRLLEIVVVSHAGEPLAPCGRCRQLLHEHGGPSLVVHTARGAVPLGDLLPDAFGPGDLA
ncbi:cytidine deaminase [Dietzia sp. ANT_WB102]|uniref:cytidine deaminase n=1 Tax=Dietzia sp. ANT_WB102 TaxID=2597345 RepID=UPI0011EE523E|nr:cytidine deaminase [Dietzia sp. ANT_WB102]KAA0916995.1 cytidine deaminase [Dietzia sp. ANT_WB102]